MASKISFGSLVALVLGCYFVFVIYKASKKLNTWNVGTIFRTLDEPNVQARQ